MIQFFVRGIPRPKGSLRPWHKFNANGKCTVGMSDQQGFNLAQWRTQIAQVARKAVEGQMPLTEPVMVALSFYLPRPANQDPAEKACKWAYTYGRNDADKLTRGVLDALTDAAVYDDDARVVVVVAEKQYASLDMPSGCRVSIQVMSEVEA